MRRFLLFTPSNSRVTLDSLLGTQTEIAGVCVVRDAADIVGILSGHYLRLGFARLSFVDDGSSDGTFELLTSLSNLTDRISVSRVVSDTFRQPELVSAAANTLIDAGYRAIVPFDADEFWNFTPADLDEIRELDLETVFFGRWTNFVQDSGVEASDQAALSLIRYRAPLLADASEAAITALRRPFVCYQEQKVAVKTGTPICLARGQHFLAGGPATVLDRDFEIFHVPLRSRREIEKRALNYEPRRAAVRECPHESWQSAFHREVMLAGRLDEVWAANSSGPDGTLDAFGEHLRLIPDDRFQVVFRQAAEYLETVFEAPRHSAQYRHTRSGSTLNSNQVAVAGGETPLTTFERRGFLGPLPILTKAQCELFVRHLERGERLPPPVWDKGWAAIDYLFYDIATQPALLGMLRLLLGENITLWGACVQSREPRQVHPWHTDIETSRPDMRSVSAWIGIENTSRDSSLQLISGSHRFGRTVQEVVKDHGLRRGDASPQMIEAWGKEMDDSARFVKPEMTDGEAIIFDGRLWHGTDNARRQGTRTAVILQFAAANEPIQIPDLTQLEWPFRQRAERPPVILICGEALPGPNQLVTPPSLVQSPPVGHILHASEGPLEGDAVSGWKPHFIFDGSTGNIDHLTVHASVLNSGCTPHPPHAHPEEEILIVLDGQAACVIPDQPNQADPRVEILRPGEFVYYPAYQFHTIQNAAAGPVSYLMMKWRGPLAFEPAQFQAPVIRPEGVDPESGERFAPRFLTELPTSYLAKLHAHQSLLLPGGGYDAHVDEHDVAIVLLSGVIETQGRRFGPNSFVFHSAGEPHGIRNVGSQPARYLVFEFHAPALARDDGATAGRLMKRMKASHAREAALASAIASMNNDLEAARRELTDVYRSRSWRVTAPLRTVGRALLRLLQVFHRPRILD